MIIITSTPAATPEKAANEKLEECYHDRPPLPFDGNGGRSPGSSTPEVSILTSQADGRLSSGQDRTNRGAI